MHQIFCALHLHARGTKLLTGCYFDLPKHSGHHLDPQMVQTMLLLLYGAGLRCSEALSLKLADVDLEQAVLTIRDSKSSPPVWSR